MTAPKAACDATLATAELTEHGIAVHADALARRLAAALANATPALPAADINPEESDLFAAMMAEAEQHGAEVDASLECLWSGHRIPEERGLSSETNEDFRPRPSGTEQVVIGHQLPVYEPKVGEIIVACRFSAEFDAIQDAVGAKETGMEPVLKFRPSIVMAACEGRALLVPISNQPDRKGRHMELSEPDELRAAGLAEDKTAYAEVLQIGEFTFPHPLVLPVISGDGRVIWPAGRISRVMHSQTAMELSRQNNHKRLKIRNRHAANAPRDIYDEMRRVQEEARGKRT